MGLLAWGGIWNIEPGHQGCNKTLAESMERPKVNGLSFNLQRHGITDVGMIKLIAEPAGNSSCVQVHELAVIDVRQKQRNLGHQSFVSRRVQRARRWLVSSKAYLDDAVGRLSVFTSISRIRGSLRLCEGH